MTKKLVLIISIQALIIVTLFWLLIFYGKDEYENFQTTQEESIDSPNRVTEKEGISIVHLALAVQKNSGIELDKVKPYTYQGNIKTFGTVMAMDGLMQAKSDMMNAQSELTLAQSGSSQHLTQYKRLKALNADDKNVSDLAVQEALALVNADQAQTKAASLKLAQLKSSITLQWGEPLAQLALGKPSSEHLSKLMTHDNVLVQVSLPMNSPAPNPNSSIYLTPINESITPIVAAYVSPALQGDASGFGKTFYYSAPANLLRTGMRVNVETDAKDNAVNQGVIIPNNAVVWHSGQPWVYVRRQQDAFIRMPISTDSEVDEGWFNQNIKPNAEIVVKGAQLLLSEEFKYLIKNENED